MNIYLLSDSGPKVIKSNEYKCVYVVRFFMFGFGSFFDYPTCEFRFLHGEHRGVSKS